MLDGPQCRSGQVRNISPLPGFDTRTVQPVASHYTDWATRVTGKTQIKFWRNKLITNITPLKLKRFVTLFEEKIFYARRITRFRFKESRCFCPVYSRVWFVSLNNSYYMWVRLNYSEFFPNTAAVWYNSILSVTRHEGRYFPTRVLSRKIALYVRNNMLDMAEVITLPWSQWRYSRFCSW
jgi:hypothetical protein